jgi:hypothetical protein
MTMFILAQNPLYAPWIKINSGKVGLALLIGVQLT